MTNSKKQTEVLEERLRTDEFVWVKSKDLDRVCEDPKYNRRPTSEIKTTKRVQRKLQRIKEPLACQIDLGPQYGSSEGSTWSFRYLPLTGKLYVYTSHRYYDLGSSESHKSEAQIRSLRSLRDLLFTGTPYYEPAFDVEAMLDAYKARLNSRGKSK